MSLELLTQNSELRKAGVYNWTIPAHVVRLRNGKVFNACPNAGVCARVCYAKFGTYQFPQVKRAHLANLEYVLYRHAEWKTQMLNELGHSRFNPTGYNHRLDHDPNDVWLAAWISSGGKAVRIHDAGDFFADWYLADWTQMAEHRPHILFYAYTKELSLVKAHGELPENFRIIYSFGGQEDHLIDRNTDRHADVFPNLEALTAAGYYDQEQNDLLAVTAPTNRIGIVQNNLPVARKRFDGRTMSELQVRKPQQAEQE